jgi:hypothetical protein
MKMERYQRLPYFGTLRETGREVDQETAGEDQQSWVEVGMT